jgi:hypothetical protein
LASWAIVETEVSIKTSGVIEVSDVVAGIVNKGAGLLLNRDSR